MGVRERGGTTCEFVDNFALDATMYWCTAMWPVLGAGGAPAGGAMTATALMSGRLPATVELTRTHGASPRK